MENTLSRRNFLAGAAMAGIAAAGVAAVAKADETAASAEADGTVTVSSPVAGSSAWNAPSWATKPEPIADDQIIETIETEVLILGAGNAGVLGRLLGRRERLQGPGVREDRPGQRPRWRVRRLQLAPEHRARL